VSGRLVKLGNLFMFEAPVFDNQILPDISFPADNGDDGMSVSWHDVSYSIGSRVVLSGVTGSIVPGGLTALIGPHQSGKSTLFEVIASQFSREAKVKGEVRVNGRPYNLDRDNNFRSFISLVSENSRAMLPPDSSAREIIHFHVKLRLPFEDESEHTHRVLDSMALTNHADAPVSALSVGERMRLLIGIELVRAPALLLIDQPLEGLDVFDSFGLIQVLRSVCSRGKVSILFSASRLSSEVAFSLDRLCVLSKGSVAYQGKPSRLAAALADCGHPCPSQHSPIDFVILLLQSASWAEHWAIIEHWRWTFGNQVESDSPRKPNLLMRTFSPMAMRRPPMLKQFTSLVSREYLQLARSPDIIVTKLVTTLALSFLVGGLYYQLGAGEISGSLLSLQNYTGAVGFILMTSLFGEVEMVAATIPLKLKRFLVEYSAGMYGSLVFFAAQVCVELPLAALTNLSQLLVVYFLVGLQGNFLFWFLCLFAVSVSCNSSGWLISCISRSTLTAMQLLPIVFLPQILFAGVIVKISIVPVYVSWLQYFCYLKYIFNLAFLNQFSAEMTSNSVVQAFAVSNNINSGDTSSSAGAVCAIVIGLRIISAVVLSRRARSAI